MSATTYLGRDCVKGHGGLRYQSNFRCVECCKADSASRYDKESERARKAAYRLKKRLAAPIQESSVSAGG